MSLSHPLELLPADYFRRLTPAEIFPDPCRPLELDVGCGDGTFLLEMATHFPERDFLGIERLNGRAQKICRKAQRLGLTNLKVLAIESSYALQWLLPPHCASRMHLLFPDPWPKKRHAHHRFLRPQTLPVLHSVLRPGSDFLFKTDHRDLYDESLPLLAESPLFTASPWDDVAFYPLTDFEQQWLGQGCQIHRGRWRTAPAEG